MSIEVTSRAGTPVQHAPPPRLPEGGDSLNASPVASVPVRTLERPSLHQPQKVDLGFRPEDLRKNIQEAVGRLNDQMASRGRHLRFSVDEEINRTVITIKNRQTGEVVRQIPSEEVVKLAHSIEDLKGLLFNEEM